MSDQAVRARVDGRQSTAQRLIWQLDAGSLRLRCLLTPGGGAYEVQARTATGLQNVGGGDDPMALLKKIITASSVVDTIAQTVEHAKVGTP